MALIPCYECSTEVSTAASACPKCGAPTSNGAQSAAPKIAKTRPVFKVLGGILVVLAIFAAIEKTNESPSGSAETVAQPSTPEPPHNYALHENGEYGYESAISDDERKQGVVTKPLTIIRYLGKFNGSINVVVRDGQNYTLFSCKEPCDFVKAQGFDHGQLLGDTQLRSTPGSLIHAVMSDAMAGQLEQYKVPGFTAPAATPPH